MALGILAAIVLLIRFSVAGQEPLRVKYQRVISQQYPGFRILEPHDFETNLRLHWRDGRSGSLLVGRFNYDAYLDFAAWIRSDEKKRYRFDHPFDYYTSKIVTCFGNADGVSFRCVASDGYGILTLPNDTDMHLIGPGSHTCAEERGSRKIVTQIDSVGTSSEKGASFLSRNRDGTTYTCVTAD